jgi:hypothetical protein
MYTIYKELEMKKGTMGLTAALLAVALAGMIAALTGCASNSGGGPAGNSQTRGPILGAEGIPQPEWVRKIPEDPDFVYFVGEGRAGKTSTVRKNSASADAGRQVGDWKESTIKAAIKDYVQEAGETGNTQSLELLEVASIQRARANTSGIKEVESWIAPDNSYIGLWRYPKEDLKQDFKTEANNFARNDSAAYAEFKADEAFRRLEQEMEK